MRPDPAATRGSGFGRDAAVDRRASSLRGYLVDVHNCDVNA
jgi:hypothetical protein